MKEDVLPRNWCVKSCQKVAEYVGDKDTRWSKTEGVDKDMYYGYLENHGFRRINMFFGQILTEQQFLYCISDPERGEEIEVSNTDFDKEKRNAIFFGECNGGAIVEDGIKLDFYENYRRKPLIFKIDKWIKEKAAFAEGKTIQCKREDSKGRWMDNIYPNWAPGWIYRIKPEPKYVPFTREDWDLFKGKELINTPDNGAICMIYGCNIFGVRLGFAEISYQEAFKTTFFADGSIFGKLIEE